MSAFEWAAAKTGSEPPEEFYCATRDVAVARIESFHVLAEKQGIPLDTSALLAAIAGELAKLAGTDFQFQTGNAQLTFTSPVATKELPTHIHVGETPIPGTYGELTFPHVRRTLANP